MYSLSSIIELNTKNNISFNAKKNQAKTKKETHKFLFGGPKRIRTAGLVNANDALYQLSYGPLLR